MTTGSEIALRADTAVAPREQFNNPLIVTPVYVERQKQSLALINQLVNETLVEGRDYGMVPGVPDEFLWDAGAGQIIGAFSCHPGPARIIKDTDDGTKISVILEIPLMSFETGQEMGCGLGAASTLETKHKYRWVKESDLEDWGYETKEARATLKTKKNGYGTTVYRILNPEHAELVNTVWKMAAKRARVAAAKNLPGVAAVLAERFSKKSSKGQQPEQRVANQWDVFWSAMKQRGLTSEQVHALLGVDSIKTWLANNPNKTPADAIWAIDAALAQQKAGPPLQAAQAGGTAPGSSQGETSKYSGIESLVSDLRWTARDLMGALRHLKIPVKTDGTVTDIAASLTPEELKTVCDYMQGLLNKSSRF